MKFHRLLSLIAGQAWAMHEPALDAMLRYVEARGRNEAPDLDELVAALSLAGRVQSLAAVGPAALAHDPGYVIDRGVAVLDVDGPLVKRPSFCFESTAEIGGRLAAAVADPRVQAILLNVDSPGGTVDGTKELADAVAAANQAKPVYAYADGLMASAAYWIGSSARMVAAPASAVVGSIGTKLVHYDVSRQQEACGVRVTHLSVGAYKSAGNDAEPLGESARAYLVEHLTSLNDLFVQAVAANRGLTPEAVLGLEAKVFVAGQALAAGLVDRIVASRDEYMNLIFKELAMPGTQSAPATAPGQSVPAAPLSAPAAQPGAGGFVPAASPVPSEASRPASAEAERERVLTAAAVLFGTDARARLSSLVALGLTADQMQTMAQAGLLAGSAPAAPSQETDLATRQAMLTALQAASSGGVAPAAPAGPADAERAAIERMANVANRAR